MSKFSDNIIRTSLEEVFVIRTSEEMLKREEASSHMWELARFNIFSENNTKSYKIKSLYKTLVRDLKIGENIYTEKGKFIAYRVN